jgi:2-polyprenyl-6-methoxyphenol hydroxylase-like FAD-dependent oxidoreductase
LSARASRLVAAAELGRRGVHVRVIDRLGAPTEESRAIGVHGRSMDMFDQMGIAEELIATGVKTIAFQMYAGHKPLFRVPLGGVDAAFPFMVTTAQTETERVLGEHLRSVGVVVDHGAELVGLPQDNAAVQLRVRHADGSIGQAGAWVVGVDGASSTVRELVGTKLEGKFARWRWLVADVDADNRLDLDCAHMFLSAEGPVVAMPMRDGRMRFLAQVRTPATPANPEPTRDELQEIIDGALAERLGLTNGGRVVVRPDGYIGAITTLDDTTTTIADYSIRIAS